MLGMHYAIDVAFVDRAGQVVKVRATLPPFGFAAAVGADAAWEFAAGTCAKLDIVRGKTLTFVPA